MHAVLRVDLEARIALVLPDNLIDASRAVTLRRLVIERQIVADRDRRILELQVDGLILLMIGVRQEHRREAVEADDAIGLG